MYYKINPEYRISNLGKIFSANNKLNNRDHS